MAFIRIKKIKKIEYTYLVKNKWTKNGARQKVGGYLGKLIRLEPKKEGELFDKSLFSLEPSILINKIIEHELFRHGFKQAGDKLKCGELVYIPDKQTLFGLKAKPIVLYMNEGYFCTHSVQEVFGFNFQGNETQVATTLANTFIDAGLKIPQDLFVSLFKKIYKPDMITKIA